MVCSDGTTCTVDAQPNFSPGWPEGAVAQTTGFTSITMTTSWAIDSFLAVGASSGGERTISCPPDTMIVGMAGGAATVSWGLHPRGFLANLQLQCANPYVGNNNKLRSLLRSGSNFPRVVGGRSCRSVTTTATDRDWLSLALKLNVNVNALMRSNPALSGALKPNTLVFVPPCVNGALPPTKPTGLRAVPVKAVPRPDRKGARPAALGTAGLPAAAVAAAEGHYIPPADVASGTIMDIQAADALGPSSTVEPAAAAAAAAEPLVATTPDEAGPGVDAAAVTETASEMTAASVEADYVAPVETAAAADPAAAADVLLEPADAVDVFAAGGP